MSSAQDILKKLSNVFSGESRKKTHLDIQKVGVEFFDLFPELQEKIIIVDRKAYRNGEQFFQGFKDQLESAMLHLQPDRKERVKKAIMSGFDGRDNASACYTRSAENETPLLVVVFPLLRDMTAAEIIENWIRSKKIKKLRVTADIPSFVSDEQMQRFILDHELAHALENLRFPQNEIADKKEKENFEECVADAFALMQHYQRGGDDGLAKVLCAARAVLSMHDYNTTHYTCAAIREVMRMKSDYTALSSEQLFEKAVSVAKHTFCRQQEMEMISEEVAVRMLQAHFCTDTEDYGKASNVEKTVAFLSALSAGDISTYSRDYIKEYMAAMKNIVLCSKHLPQRSSGRSVQSGNY